ncbi:hypothetical protein CYY_006585 [Polysphondylium violaceum]|uniref:Expansin-like EG45 domain-containing protein n=1 Tax=Polysphondylium violaceum TaxID=133409 RepID=A0A8J4PS14_9MYCE|nr:hypothetical protein CYY_006585 [Polysphondylium violaceum]
MTNYKQLYPIIGIVLLSLFINSAKSDTPLGDCFSSRSTWYEAVEHGNCGYGPLTGETGPGNRFIAAAATVLYNGSAVCGECFEVNGPMGTQVVTIVDQCPDPGWCDTSFPHLDLSPEAFAVIGGSGVGVTMTTAKKVACDYVTGNIKLKMKDADTTASWFEFMIFNHKVGIASVDVETADGKTYSLPRRLYNYWTFNNAAAKFPVIAHVTSIYGERVDVYIKAPTGNQISEGEGQFSAPKDLKLTNTNCTAPLSVDPSGWIYNDGLVKPLNYSHPNLGWTDWSNGVTVNWADASTGGGATGSSKTVVSGSMPVNTGIQIGTDLPLNWKGIFTNLEFYIKGDAAFSGLIVQYSPGTEIPTPVTTTWTKFSYALDTDMGAPESLGKPTVLKFRTGGTAASPGKIYIDKIRLTPVAASA